MASISEMTQRMIEYSRGNLHDIDHFMKVWGYAKVIGELEKLDERTQFILEAAAILHDIACPLCREKYGSTEGHLQEAEGARLAADFLRDTEISQEQKDRIAYLVGRHHTYDGVDGMDHQILLEADYLVNAGESGYSRENIINVRDVVFKTKAGIGLLNSMYLS